MLIIYFKLIFSAEARPLKVKKEKYINSNKCQKHEKYETNVMFEDEDRLIEKRKFTCIREHISWEEDRLSSGKSFSDEEETMIFNHFFLQYMTGIIKYLESLEETISFSGLRIQENSNLHKNLKEKSTKFLEDAIYNANSEIVENTELNDFIDQKFPEKCINSGIEKLKIIDKIFENIRVIYNIRFKVIISKLKKKKSEVEIFEGSSEGITEKIILCLIKLYLKQYVQDISDYLLDISVKYDPKIPEKECIYIVPPALVYQLDNKRKKFANEVFQSLKDFKSKYRLENEKKLMKIVL